MRPGKMTAGFLDAFAEAFYRHDEGVFFGSSNCYGYVARRP
jgi:hypothetical protein